LGVWSKRKPSQLKRAKEGKMENNTAIEKEKTIIMWQYRAVIVALIVIIPFGILTRLAFPPFLKYVVLTAILPMFYIAISSIRDRISIFRFKRMQSDYARGAQAMIFGIVFLIVEIVTFIFILSDSFFNF
jgi:hypothetical protein